MSTSSGCRFARLVTGVVCCLGVLILGAGPALAKKGGNKGHHRGNTGAVYTQTQDPAGNQVVLYQPLAHRANQEPARRVEGRLGAGAAAPFHLPILDSQGGVELT